MTYIHFNRVSMRFPHFSKFAKAKKQQTALCGGRLEKTGHHSVSVCALEDLSFQLTAGDRVAVIGHNGAGKTTLFRLIAGLYAPTSGSISVSGRVSSIINLNFGLENNASGYENIIIRGLYLGMTKKQIHAQLDEMVDFAELGDFLHLPLHTYSAGMRARLAFSVAIHRDADILVLDEVLGTGDHAFLKKVRQKLHVFAQKETILVFASHADELLRQLCNKALLLTQGQLTQMGPLEEVLSLYADQEVG